MSNTLRNIIIAALAGRVIRGDKDSEKEPEMEMFPEFNPAPAQPQPRFGGIPAGTAENPIQQPRPRFGGIPAGKPKQPVIFNGQQYMLGEGDQLTIGPDGNPVVIPAQR